MNYLFYIVFLVFCLQSVLFSGTTGASFLKLGVGARQVGMGNAFTAIADDVTATYWNPAGLSKLDRMQVGAMHSEWISDIRYDYIGFVNPLKQNNSIGVSLLYLYMGEIEGRNEDRSQSGSFTSYDLAVTLSYSKKINSRLNLGTNLKFIHETIEKENANGAAIDLGLLYASSIKDLTFGINVQNIGPAMKYINESYNLPLAITGGAAYSLFGIMNIALDLKTQPLDGRTDLSFGAELSPIRALTFRTGYITKLVNAIASSRQISATDRLKDISGLALGLGFKIFSYQLDYSFIPYENLGDTHRVSFIKGF